MKTFFGPTWVQWQFWNRKKYWSQVKTIFLFLKKIILNHQIWTILSVVTKFIDLFQDKISKATKSFQQKSLNQKSSRLYLIMQNWFNWIVPRLYSFGYSFELIPTSFRCFACISVRIINFKALEDDSCLNGKMFNNFLWLATLFRVNVNFFIKCNRI